MYILFLDLYYLFISLSILFIYAWNIIITFISYIIIISYFYIGWFALLYAFAKTKTHIMISKAD